ncbi:MAG: amino acid ABC transporter substrate-binding protein [Betaproteobacteria bacterium]|nr:amino acid ABC transporter substrate-binding protein [Betaproteobacteria bacterium]
MHRLSAIPKSAVSILLGGLLWAGIAANAQTAPAPSPAPADTLKRIAETKTVLIGVREASIPFSYLDADKLPTGYAVDLCLKVVDQIKKTLKQPGLRPTFVVLASADRIPALLDGRVDMECGSTTNTTERQKQVAFSYTYFVTGARVLARKQDRIAGLTNLRGGTVALTKGTTGERLVREANDKERLNLSLQVLDSNDASFAAVESGAAKAFVTDDILLFGLIAKSAKPETYEVVGQYLSIEPYAIMMRKGDEPFRKVVNSTLAKLYTGGEAARIYNRWFVNNERRIPMSRRLKESFAQPSDAPAYP